MFRITSTFIAVILMGIASRSYAGWFGPNKSDKDKVTIMQVSDKCDSGYAFELHNSSEYTVNKVEFKVYGKITGRSTVYDLRFNSQDFVNDKILAPYLSSKFCISLNQNNWPTGEKLIFSTEISSVEFQIKDSVETVY